MPQTLKPEIRRNILAAAVMVFSEKGCKGSSMAEIAKRAGISTGNIYRYFPDKDALYDAALPKKLSEWLKESIRNKMELSVADWESSQFRLRQQELLQLLLDYRREWCILFRNAQGTAYENLNEEMTEYLLDLFTQYLASNGLEERLNHPGFKSTLREIYRNVIIGLSNLLASESDQATLSNASSILFQYHLAGIRELCRIKLSQEGFTP